ncbi:hypothetical protein ScPMuIL_010752 [Solemya velum]
MYFHFRFVLIPGTVLFSKTALLLAVEFGDLKMDSDDETDAFPSLPSGGCGTGSKQQEPRKNKGTGKQQEPRKNKGTVPGSVEQYITGEYVQIGDGCVMNQVVYATETDETEPRRRKQQEKNVKNQPDSKLDLTLGSRMTIHGGKVNINTEGPIPMPEATPAGQNSLTVDDMASLIRGFPSVDITGGGHITTHGAVVNIGRAATPTPTPVPVPVPVPSAPVTDHKKTATEGQDEGTAFLVGERYAFTAWHVVKKIVESMELPDPGIHLDRLKSEKVYINFGSPGKKTTTYYISGLPYKDEDLDVALLELQPPGETDVTSTPLRFGLCDATELHIVGYGHRKFPNDKQGDLRCQIINSNSDEYKSACAWLEENKSTFDDVDYGDIANAYGKIRNEDFVCCDSFLTFGASGSPMAVMKNGDRFIVGIYTQGIPGFYWQRYKLFKNVLPEKELQLFDIFNEDRREHNEDCRNTTRIAGTQRGSREHNEDRREHNEDCREHNEDRREHNEDRREHNEDRQEHNEDCREHNEDCGKITRIAGNTTRIARNTTRIAGNKRRLPGR